MLLLAPLLTRNPEWRRSSIKVLSLVSSELMREQTAAYLARFLPEIRITAEADVMMIPEDRSVREVIHDKSSSADVVFMELHIPENYGELSDYTERSVELAGPLRTFFFVKNFSRFVGKLIQTIEELFKTTQVK